MERYVGKEVNDFWGGRQMKVNLKKHLKGMNPIVQAYVESYDLPDLREMLVIIEERKEITNQGFYGWRNVLYRAGAYEFEGTYCLLAGGSHGQEDGRRGFFRICRCG